MPITDRSKAKESGFAQVRAALQKFEGTVTRAEFGQWGGKLYDDEGKPVPPREFLEVESKDVVVHEVTEELAMDITEWNFRVNCSDYAGSFWVEKFLESADRAKVQIPDELAGKRIVWEKTTLEARDPKFNSTNYVIAEVKAAPASGQPAPQPSQQAPPAQAPAEGETQESFDPMEAALEVAVGKTEQQFRTAVGLDPRFANSPLLNLAKAGAITQSLVNEGRLVLVKEGNNQVYKRP